MARQCFIRLAAGQADGEPMQRPVLIDRLNLATRQGDDRKMKARREWRSRPPVLRLRKLRAP